MQNICGETPEDSPCEYKNMKGVMEVKDVKDMIEGKDTKDMMSYPRQGKLYCNLCGAQFNSVTQAEHHYKGKSHRRRTEQSSQRRRNEQRTQLRLKK